MTIGLVQAPRVASDVITGPQFRRKLGWGKDRFYAAVKSGRFQHLISQNVSTPTRVVYVREKVDLWIRETASVFERRLRA